MGSSNSSIHSGFAETVAAIERIVLEAHADVTPDLSALDDFGECVYIKNDASAVVECNDAYAKLTAGRQSSLGRTGRMFLDRSIVELSEHSDRLVMAGARAVELEHVGTLANGVTHALLTHKRRLKLQLHPGLAILGVTRIGERVDGPHAASLANSARLLGSFHALEKRDREVCRLVAGGASSRQIAEQFGMTARAIEMRRHKIFEKLGVSSTLQLACDLVRLQERGLLDLGL